MMKPAVILFALSLHFAATAAAEVFLVKDGQPRAEIVVAMTAKRTTRLAAQELQDGIKKISGAHLPVVNEPTGKAAKIFVGPSKHADALKITTAGLKDEIGRAHV